MRLVEFFEAVDFLSRIVREIKRVARANGVKIEFSKTKQPMTLILTDLNAVKPGKGGGTKVMTALGKLADQEGVSIIVHPDTARNTKFYKRFEFEDGYPMVRRPDLPPGSFVNESAIPSIPWYHGTGTSSRLFRLPKDPHPSGIGLWFTANKEVADTFARRAVRMIDEVPQVAEVRVNSNNPKHYHDYREYLDDWGKYNDARKLRRALKRKGHDAIVIDHSTTDIDIQRVDIAVFNIRQIRVVNVEQLTSETGR